MSSPDGPLLFLAGTAPRSLPLFTYSLICPLARTHARTHARVPSTGIFRLIVPYCASCCPACPEPAYCGLLRLTARDATKALNQIPPSPTRSSSSACCTRCLGRRLPAVEAGPAVPRQPKQAGEGQAGRLPPRPSRLACPPRRLPVCRYTCRSACLPACLPVSVQAADGAAETSRRLAARCLNRVRARVHAAAGSRARIIVAARSLNCVIAYAPACGACARSRCVTCAGANARQRTRTRTRP